MNFDLTQRPALRTPTRSEAAQQGHEAVEISARGDYFAPSGRRVDLAASIEDAVVRTTDHRPDAKVDRLLVAADEAGETRSRGGAPRTQVVNGTSLASARAFAARGIEPLVLNFASAKSPGGGFLSGARAQEESLARASALYACIVNSPMYGFHQGLHDAMYSSWMIYSPSVPVFRDDDGALLEEPWSCAFLTAPAPNAKVVLERSPDRADELCNVMKSRVRRALAIAALHHHRHLVLGAWGCGVFGNDPAFVAAKFREELDGAFRGAFDEVVFAVLDTSPERRFVRPFAELFT
jgi:uncharacterized protein (TIGR02452 family)